MHPQHHLHPIAPAPPGFHHGSGSGPILPLKAKEPEILESNESSVPQKNKKSPAASGNGTGTTKRRKVNHACLYCRRSHMHCDEARPCQRCVKRDIGHLCKDEPKPKQSTSSNPPASPAQQQQSAPPSLPVPAAPFPSLSQPPASLSLTNPDAFQSIVPFNVPEQSQAWPLLPTTPSFAPDSTTVGNEFSVLSEFLESLDDRSFFANPSATNPASSLLSSTPLLAQQSNVTPSSVAATMFSPLDRLQSQLPQQAQISPSIQSAQTPMSIASDLLQLQQQQPQPSKPELEHVDPLPPTTKTERYLMTAADQESGTRDERLAAVIHSKYEAGLLKPYNYVKGYARLSRWMERNVSPESRQAILQPISVLRPKFRAIAQNLTDIDLVFVEEAFERMLLDYDRVFSAMGIPACLWRRTGEIYKGNKQFADLVGVDVNRLREGRLCIYELMSEDSAVNYWEKYGHVAFDPSQKAVLTSCVLRYKPKIGTNLSSSASASGGNSSLLRNNTRRIRLSASEKDNDDEDIFINCCFSFTIRRDMWGIPSMIVGNFIKC